MQLLKDVAQQARFQAMQPGAISERQALDQAIARVAHDGGNGGHDIITKICSATRCSLHTGLNAVWLYPWSNPAFGNDAGLSLGRQHGSANGHTWFGTERAIDSQGRVWECSFNAVVDDFGSLVEVAR